MIPRPSVARKLATTLEPTLVEETGRPPVIGITTSPATTVKVKVALEDPPLLVAVMV